MADFIELPIAGGGRVFVNPDWVVYIRPLEAKACSVVLHNNKAWEVEGSAEDIRLLLSGRVR